jgi:hypothetical protein
MKFIDFSLKIGKNHVYILDPEGIYAKGIARA